MNIDKWLENQRIKFELQLTETARELGSIGPKDFIVCPKIQISQKGFRREEKVYSVSLSDIEHREILALDWGVRHRKVIEAILANLEKQPFWVEAYGSIMNSTFRKAGLKWRLIWSYRRAELKSTIENGNAEEAVIYYVTNAI